MLQLNKDKALQGQPTIADMESILNGGFDFDALEKNPQVSHSNTHTHTECPGEPVIDYADSTKCSHAGIDIHVDSETIEKYFGDNVLMKDFKYYLEDCASGSCTYSELIAPGIENHHFQVGVSHVKVEGYDLAGNKDHCFRTVYIYDNEPPVFDSPDADVDGTITIKLSDDTCDIDAGTPFASYELVGFLSSATDNCDTDVQIVKKIFDTNGECVYDSTKDTVSMTLPLGPGSYHMTYEAIDGHSETLGLPTGEHVTLSTTIHTATLNLVDETPPYNTSGCPTETITVLIEAHEEMGQVDWTPPTVTGDACGNEGMAYVEEQSTPKKEPGMMLPVGSHQVEYAFMDMHHNVMDEVCIFEVKIEQKAHPVEVVCPADVTVPTLENARAGIVHWSDPVATQGTDTLPASQIHYVQGVTSGMMFPFGITTITVNATGLVTGTRVDEHLQFDECLFTVTVTDPFDPLVDGRPYRCKNKDSPDVQPYKVCEGPDVTVHLHELYIDNFAYQTLGAVEKSGLSCCESEDDTLHECVAVPGSSLNKYCKPVA
jgi:hypothetical protein